MTSGRDRHEELFSRAGAIFSKIAELASRSPDVTLIRENEELVGLVSLE